MKRLLILAVLVVSMLGLSACEGDQPTYSNGLVYQVENVEVNGRQVPCVFTYNAISCDWNAK